MCKPVRSTGSIEAIPLVSSPAPPTRPAPDRRPSHLRWIRRRLRGIAISPNRRIRDARRHQTTATWRDIVLTWLLCSRPVHPGTRRQHLILAQWGPLELRIEQQPPPVASDELNTEQFGHFPLMPRRAGEDTVHRVNRRLIAGQRAAQHPRLGPLGQIPYDQN